jgi:LmbE family N-acetylglucosaminyl deacetylase
MDLSSVRDGETAVVDVRDISELGTILSVWPHPDDDAYLCPGAMAMATAAGSRVVCVTGTRGELGVTDPARNQRLLILISAY